MKRRNLNFILHSLIVDYAAGSFPNLESFIENYIWCLQHSHSDSDDNFWVARNTWKHVYLCVIYVCMFPNQMMLVKMVNRTLSKTLSENDESRLVTVEISLICVLTLYLNFYKIKLISEFSWKRRLRDLNRTAWCYFLSVVQQRFKILKTEEKMKYSHLVAATLKALSIESMNSHKNLLRAIIMYSS